MRWRRNRGQGQESGDGSTNIQAGGHVGGNTFNTINLGITEAKAWEIAEKVSHETVLREGRAVAEQVINERVDYITRLIFDLIKRYDEGLFNRFGDPRFLAALTAAQRGYAETADVDLASLLAGLVVGLASQPIRSRREIFQRQAITVAPQLTGEHINALSASVLISRFKVGVLQGPEQLIDALDKTLSPYYGRIPSSRMDCQYMCSVGVCEDAQLGSFSVKAYARLHEVYRNLLYPALTFSDLEANLLHPDSPDGAEFNRLLVPFVEEGEHQSLDEDGNSVVPKQHLRLRLVNEHADRLLGRRVEVSNFTEYEKRLRTTILDRSLTVEQFKEQVESSKPDLANFLRDVDSIGILEFPLQPVGLMLVRYAVGEHAPVVGQLIDHIIDKG